MQYFCFCSHFSQTELKHLKHFLYTQKYLFLSNTIRTQKICPQRRDSHLCKNKVLLKTLTRKTQFNPTGSKSADGASLRWRLVSIQPEYPIATMEGYSSQRGGIAAAVSSKSS